MSLKQIAWLNLRHATAKEPGKAVRTLYLFRYIDELEPQETIQSATNKYHEICVLID